jgi:hypothetical protein
MEVKVCVSDILMQHDAEIQYSSLPHFASAGLTIRGISPHLGCCCVTRSDILHGPAIHTVLYVFTV